MEDEEGYGYLDEHEFTRYLEGQKVIGQFPCSMSKPWFFLNSLFSLSLISLLIVLIVGVPTVLMVFIVVGGPEYIPMVGIGIGVMIIFVWVIFLIQMPKLYKEWISGNKVKLTDAGIQFFMRPYAKGPIFRNFVPYKHISTINEAGSDYPSPSMVLKIVGPMGYSFNSLFKKGQMFIPNTKKSGILTAKFDGPMPFRFGEFGYFNAYMENIPFVEEGSTIQRSSVFFDDVHFDVEKKYHSKFLEVFNKLKLKRAQELEN